MTWQGKRRKQLPSNWGAIRKQVLVRDGYRCTAIGPDEFGHWNCAIPLAEHRCAARATEVHHINGPTDHALSSLRAICSYHHAEEAQRAG